MVPITGSRWTSLRGRGYGVSSFRSPRMDMGNTSRLYLYSSCWKDRRSGSTFPLTQLHLRYQNDIKIWRKKKRSVPIVACSFDLAAMKHILTSKIVSISFFYFFPRFKLKNDINGNFTFWYMSDLLRLCVVFFKEINALSGTTDHTTITITPGVAVSKFKINILSYHRSPCLRFDLLGCSNYKGKFNRIAEYFFKNNQKPTDAELNKTLIWNTYKRTWKYFF